jgi:hypothetical protein
VNNTDQILSPLKREGEREREREKKERKEKHYTRIIKDYMQTLTGKRKSGQNGCMFWTGKRLLHNDWNGIAKEIIIITKYSNQRKVSSKWVDIGRRIVSFGCRANTNFLYIETNGLSTRTFASPLLTRTLHWYHALSCSS